MSVKASLESLKAKAADFVGKHQATLDRGLRRTTGFVNDKTNGRYADKLDAGARRFQDGVDRLRRRGDGPAAGR